MTDPNRPPPPKQIDASPSEYRTQEPDGGWRVPDHPKLYRNMFFVAVAMLVFVFWKRDELTATTLFGITAMIAFCAGGLFATWLKDVH